MLQEGSLFEQEEVVVTTGYFFSDSKYNVLVHPIL